MSTPPNSAAAGSVAPAPHDENKLIIERREKLKALRQHQADGKGVAFPNDIKPEHRAEALFAQYDSMTKEELEALAAKVHVAGRMMLKRVMGKASFATLQDASFGPSGGRIQVYINNEGVGEDVHAAFKHWDLGDIVAATGTLFKTKTGELSIHATSIRLVTKSLRPLPDKFHGIADQEVKYRQRYVDLIMDEATRKRFMARSKAVSSIREFMVSHDFLEVETPMLHPIPGGANARPFKTHHNALDQEMFLRIAPELYLKRLIVGGFERVFEINRSYRNEGISVRHNPEFTMMEFYAAWWNYSDLMTFTEALIRDAAQKVAGSLQLTYGGKAVDLSLPFERLTIREAILKHTEAGDQVDDAAWLTSALKKRGLTDEKDRLSSRSLASLQVMYFEETVEEKLWQPTFICEHPVEISPLARASDSNPGVTERFELYITGREFGNGFSELNDAEEQAARFNAQVVAMDSGDDEAMFYDHDFIRALEYGMPPTGGCG
ncbi:MAG: lysine--tRNA ligase, partial [Polaromonas sp.]|uniref:lysine--tRNA ligase n=1 Tax=Polaromonas sp. TaxID=1869339 RepID=UPI00272FABAF